MAKKMKTGGSKKSLPKAQAGKSLTQAELDALSHQRRGMGNENSLTFVKKRGPIKNELGRLTTEQLKQLQDYMRTAPTSRKFYEGLPNIGVIVGSSAADIPKGSQLENQKKGGSKSLHKSGGSVKKFTSSPKRKK